MAESSRASSEAGTAKPPAVGVIDKMDAMTVGMRVEAKDSYGKWFSAKVVEKYEETEEVVVHFEGWSARYDELIHIKEGRLRHLSQEMLEKSIKTRKPKVVEVGDRVQAKWQDGRMYYGRVLQLLNQMAVVLFDDGVKYTTPISTVRKRNTGPSLSGCEGLQTPGSEVRERKRRQVEGKGREDSTSQPSNSPPSSPLFAPKRTHSQSSRFFETDESSWTESDEEGRRQKRDSSPACASSDGDLRPPQGKRPARDVREPYKLRKKLSRQQYAPVTRKRKPKASAAAVLSANETVTVPGDVGDKVTRGECASGEVVPSVKVEAEESKTDEKHCKLSDEKAVISEDLNRAAKGVSHDIKREKSDGDGSSRTLDPDTSSASLSSLSLPSPSPSLSLAPQHQPSASPSQSSDQKKSHPTPSTLPKSLSKSQSGTRRRAGSSSQQSSPVTTRFRAQTTFETKKLGRRRERNKQGKVAPKELVIVWDHNEFKCTHDGCTKSFRKQSLLESHMKHYHNISPPKRRAAKATSTTKVNQGESTTGKSAHSPSTPSLTKSPRSPKTPNSPLFGPSSHTSSSPATPSSSTLEHNIKKLKLDESSQMHDVSSQKPAVEKKDEMKRPAADGATKTTSVTGSKSPKKSRPKSYPLKSSSATASPSAHVVLDPVVKLSTTPVVGQPKNTSSPSSAPHTSSHHSFSSSSTSPSKSKQSSGKKHRERLSKESSKKGSDSVSKSHESPALPSSSAAALPLQRAKNQAADVSSFQKKVAGSQISVAGSDLIKRENAIFRDVKVSVVPLEGVGKLVTTEERGDFRGSEQFSRSTSPSSEANDDVVHCVCGDNTDEGFMIQCEQCLCWQHGDCIGISKASLPKQYLCCFCTNPPGLRQNRKYQYDLQWYCDGTLPSLPGGPKFPSPEAMLKCHSLLDKLYLLRKMSHSAKVKLQAASTPNHAYLRQWSKECACLDKETLKNYLATALEPIVIQKSERTKSKEAGSVESENGDSNAVKAGVDSAVGVDGAQPNREGVKLTNGDGVENKALLLRRVSERSCSVKMSVLKQAGVAPSISPPSQTLPGFRDVRESSDVADSSVPLQSSESALQCNSENKSTVMEPTKVEPDIASEFGVQELSVFAVKDSKSVKHLSASEPQQMSVEAVPSGSPTHVSQPVSLPLSPAVPLLTQRKPLQPSKPSAFKPVVITPPDPILSLCPKTPTCTSSQLTSLLTSPISTQSRSLVQQPCLPQATPTSTVHSSNVTSTCLSARGTTSVNNSTQVGGSQLLPRLCITQLSQLKLVPDVSGDPIFAETAAALPPIQDSGTVLLNEFTEAFLNGDTTNWFKRMLLLDHIESVQDSILSWVEKMEREVDELSDKGSDESEDVMEGIQAALDQLNTFHRQILGKT